MAPAPASREELEALFRGYAYVPHVVEGDDPMDMHQRIRAVLHGRFHYMDRPRLACWTGTAAYRVLGGLLTARLPEGGVLSLVEDQDGVRLAHNVYIDFPDSLRGRFCLWWFQSYLNGRQALYDHSFRELRFFKERLEDPPSADVP
jgi:xylulose-5-phosphate/fructose-6-phosphate phosphoketolase